MSCYIIALGLASGAPCEVAGQYLQWYDPDGDARLPLSHWTTDRSQAKSFASAAMSDDTWQKVKP